MFLLLETIKIFNGEPMHLQWHQNRFEKSYYSLFKQNSKLKLEKIINIPHEYTDGIVKLRFLYNRNSYNCEYSNYKPRKIESLKIVHNNNIDYSLKYTDRNCLNNLLKQRNSCDDILIIKNDIVTDSSYTNIIFFDGQQWFTPSEPLLKGTARERLLSENKIIPKTIKIQDINQFRSFKLINAMLDFETQTAMNISKILY